MKANKAEEQALISVLTRLYDEIRAVEQDWDLRGEANDYRPRIEYFHDAVRALTGGGESKRLTIEYLAYDIGMLRHIQGNPFARSKTSNKPSMSASTEMALATGGARGAKPDAEIRARLSDLYKNYAVIFSALFTETADRNYYSRVEEANAEVEDTAALEQALKAAQKQQKEVDIEELVEQHVEDPDLTNKILFQFHNIKQKKRVAAAEALRKLKDMLAAGDKELKVVEAAHFSFATGRLAIYELAKDVVKKMAVQGLNIVGNFVQNAVNEAQRGGRGM